MSRVFIVRREWRIGLPGRREVQPDGGMVMSLHLLRSGMVNRVHLARQLGVIGCGYLEYGVEKDSEAESAPSEKECHVD